MPELNPSPITQSGNQDGGRETPVVVNTEPTPLDPSPDFPVTAKPRLSPNPKSTLEFKDGGRGTPVIVNTDPKVSPDAEDAIEKALATKQDKLTFDSAPTENSTNPVTSGGVYNALQNVGGEDIVTITATGVQSDEMAAKILAAKAVYYDGKLYIKASEGDADIEFKGQNQYGAIDTQFYMLFTKATKRIETGSSSYDRVQTIDSKKGNVSLDNSLQTTGGTTSGTLGLTGQLPYLTTEPSDPNTAGFVKLVVLDAEPSAYKAGFLYFVTEPAE